MFDFIALDIKGDDFGYWKADK